MAAGGGDREEALITRGAESSGRGVAVSRQIIADEARREPGGPYDSRPVWIDTTVCRNACIYAHLDCFLAVMSTANGWRGSGVRGAPGVMILTATCFRGGCQQYLRRCRGSISSGSAATGDPF